MNKRSVSIHRRVVRVGGKKFGKTPVVREGTNCASHIADKSEIANRADNFPRWNSRVCVGNDIRQANIKSLQELVNAHTHSSQNDWYGRRQYQDEFSYCGKDL
jgi:hypothetical protein